MTGQQLSEERPMTSTPQISMIAAMSENRVIGRDNDMPWHISEDLKRFKRLTLGKPVIMGRRTFESLGRPLPGRANIVISRSLPPQTPPSLSREGGQRGEGPVYTASLPDAVTLAKKLATQGNLDEIFIIGGGQIYAQALAQNLAGRIYLTVVHDTVDGDVYFPALDDGQWKEISSEPQDGAPPFTFKIFERA